ncbi:MAG: phage tail assembly chaperone [Kiloniellaceae bacterium]
MKVALGRLGWPPAAFWAATPHEFWAAYEGWIEAHCAPGDDGGFSDEEIETIEDMKRRFPDEPPWKTARR